MAPAKRRARKKAASRKQRKGTSRSKTAPRKGVKKARAARKPAGARRKPATRKRAATQRKPAATTRKPAPPNLAVAQKIIRMSQRPSFGPAEIRELYHDDASSVEASGAVARGHAELEEKMRGWEQMTAGMRSEVRNVWTGPHTVCIEWASTVTMRDGRSVQLEEIAVHEIEDGKIRSERYYYDPSALAPPAQSGGLPPSA